MFSYTYVQHEFAIIQILPQKSDKIEVVLVLRSLPLSDDYYGHSVPF